jgi:lipopolysaccharide biosynthesis regulator YciM
MRRRYVRPLLAVGLLAGLASVALLNPRQRQCRPEGQDWDLTVALGWFVHDKGDQLLARTAAIDAQITAKERMCGDLIAGRATLSQAVIEFRRLHVDDPYYLRLLRQAYPGCSDEECICRNVIHYVSKCLNHSEPPAQRTTLARLEEQMRTHLAVQAELTSDRVLRPDIPK